jgi:FkbM family methyltransferase
MNKLTRTLGFIFKHPLGGKHPLKSISRLMKWQLQCSIFPSKLFIKEFIGPIKFYAIKGLTGITGNIYVGLHEFDDMMFLLHLLRRDDTFFDVGANVGAYTLLASGVCKAKSIALEPIKATFNLLNLNLQLNKLNGVVAINSAAGAIKGTLEFTSENDTTNHVVAINERVKNGIVSVPVLTIDSLNVNSLPILIKIDVEGFETEVLKGMEDTLNSPSLKAIIIELNGSGARYGYDEEKIHDLLRLKGFSPSRYNPFKRILSALENHGHENTIYCRDLDFINERLATAECIPVMGELI